MSKRNNAVDMFRYVAAIMVVMIHTQPFAEINSNLGFICSKILPRVAVPFFFSIAGYYYIGRLMEGKHVFKKYISNLILVYTLWSVVYFMENLVIQILQYHQVSLMKFLQQCLKNYFIYGSNYHLWFFQALIISVIVATACYKVKVLAILAKGAIVLYIFGCLGSSYFSIGNQIPIFSVLINGSHFTLIRRIVLMGLPFFMLGYFLNVHKTKIIGVRNKFVLGGGLATFIIFVLEIIIVVTMQIEKEIIVTFFLYPLVAVIITTLLKNPMRRFDKFGGTLRRIANFTYYIHPLIIIILKGLAKYCIVLSTPTVVFFITTVFCTVVGLGVTKQDNKWIKRLVS